MGKNCKISENAFLAIVNKDMEVRANINKVETANDHSHLAVRLSVSRLLFEKQVDECAHVTDVDFFVAIHVGSFNIEVLRWISQQVIDNGTHVADVEFTIIVHITQQ